MGLTLNLRAEEFGDACPNAEVKCWLRGIQNIPAWVISMVPQILGHLTQWF
jgi:hypothetical protein